MAATNRQKLDKIAREWREHYEDEFQLDTTYLVRGVYNPAQLQDSIRAQLKDLYIRQAIIAVGARDILDASDWGVIGSELRAQYGYLDTLVQQVITKANGAANGDIDPTTGKPYEPMSPKMLWYRLRSFSKQSRYIYERIRVKHGGKPDDVLIYTRHREDSCAVCIERDGTIATRDSLPFYPGKGTICLFNCACTWENHSK